MPSPRQENASIFLAAAGLLTFSGNLYGVWELIFRPVPVVLLLSSGLGFLFACALITRFWPEVPPFAIGFGFGILPGCAASFAAGLWIACRFFGVTSLSQAPFPLWIPAGALVWGLAAIPICAFFRRVFPRLRRP